MALRAVRAETVCVFWWALWVFWALWAFASRCGHSDDAGKARHPRHEGADQSMRTSALRTSSPMHVPTYAMIVHPHTPTQSHRRTAAHSHAQPHTTTHSHAQPHTTTHSHAQPHNHTQQPRNHT
eukprot:15029776-Alexandrium_andersonii.AAC.1